MPSPFLTLLSSALWAAAAGGLAWVVGRIALAPREVDPALGRFEVERRDALRAASPIYRWFEPLVDELAAAAERGPQVRLDQVADDLVGSGERAPWRASEHLAVQKIESVVAAVVAALLGWPLGGGVTAALFALFGAGMYQWYAARSLRSRSFLRRTSIRRRLASAIELMSLMMEVGASFPEALETVAKEAGSHPLGEELRRVLRDLSLGRQRTEALRGFAERMVDDDSRELISAIIEGETLGTPLADTMRTQAEQLRLKRSQWAEKAAEESKVALVFPAMLIMAACLVIVVAPFILSALYTYPG